MGRRDFRCAVASCAVKCRVYHGALMQCTHTPLQDSEPLPSPPLVFQVHKRELNDLRRQSGKLPPRAARRGLLLRVGC